MQFTKAIAVLAAAASVHAYSNDTIVYTTLVVDSYVTVCPASSTITFNGGMSQVHAQLISIPSVLIRKIVTYTNTLTESSTITITNCPCTVSAPVTTVSSVYCNTWYPRLFPNTVMNDFD
jgi:hypothetical protein